MQAENGKRGQKSWLIEEDEASSKSIASCDVKGRKFIPQLV